MSIWSRIEDLRKQFPDKKFKVEALNVAEFKGSPKDERTISVKGSVTLTQKMFITDEEGNVYDNDTN